MADDLILGERRSERDIIRFSAASFPFLWSIQPPRRAFTCDAGRSLDLVEQRRNGKWPLPFPKRLSGCHHLLCPLCGPRVVRSRIRRMKGRLERAAASAVGLAGLTLTIAPFPLGRLADQLDALSTAWTKTRTNGPYDQIVEVHGVVGFLRAIHPRFSDGTWKAHFHVVVAATDDMQAQMAAVALGERYKFFLRRAGYPVNGRTVEVRDASDPEAVAVYYCDIWKADGPDGLRALFVDALHGDPTARQAYEEMVHALRGRAPTLGSGVLGAGEA
jgi:hypothetical protein